MDGPRSASPRVDRELRCALAALPNDLAAFGAACGRVTDWPALLRAAHEHGVDGVLLAAGRRAGIARSDAAWQEAALRERQALVWRDVLRDALGAVLSALGAAGVRSAVLKGPVLAARFYDDAVRPSCDLDLLVDPRSLDAAAGALAPLGYALEGDAAGRFFRRHHHHVHLHHPALPPIELHFDAYRGFGTVLPAGPLLERSEPCRAAGWEKARVLAPEDEILYLAVHAASHRFRRLVWAYDMKLVALAHPDLRWDVVAERARAHDLSAVVSFASALLAGTIDGAPGASARVPALNEARLRLARRLARPRAGHLAEAAADFLFAALLCDGPARAAAHSARYVRIKVLHEAPRRLRARLVG